MTSTRILFSQLMIFLFFTGIFLTVCTIHSYAATYYVSPSGNDTDSGTTITTPFKTIKKGASVLNAGDTLYIRAGTYAESPIFPRSGTSAYPILVSGYQNEIPILDGQNTIPSGCYDFLLALSVSYFTVQNLKVINSNGGGIFVGGTNNTLKNVTVDHTGETGIVLAGSYNTADGVTVHKNGQRYGNGCNTWGSALSSIGINNTIKNSLSYENRGEGLNSYGGASGTVIEDNISYNNSIGLYLDSTTGVRAQRNLIYFTPDSTQQGDGIVIGHETSPLPSSNTIINNIVYGAFLNFSVDGKVTDLANTVIANNTFVNSSKSDSDISSGYNMSIYFRPGITSFSNSKFENNIIVEEDTRLTPISIGSPHSGLTFSNNLYNKSYSPYAAGTGDLVQDPLFTKSGTIAAGQLTADYFKLQTSSPAINAGASEPMVIEDYFKMLRPIGAAYDIGAHEFDPSAVTPTPRPSPTNTPTPTPLPTSACLYKSSGDADCNDVVDLVDFEIWRKEYNGTLSTKNADFNGSSAIDIVDFELWRKGFYKV